MLSVDARFMSTAGKGVGRWRTYYRAEDLRDAQWAARHLVDGCQIRVRDGRTVVVGPCRADAFKETAA